MKVVLLTPFMTEVILSSTPPLRRQIASSATTMSSTDERCSSPATTTTTLVSVANYVKALQVRSACLDEEHKKLMVGADVKQQLSLSTTQSHQWERKNKNSISVHHIKAHDLLSIGYTITFSNS